VGERRQDDIAAGNSKSSLVCLLPAYHHDLLVVERRVFPVFLLAPFVTDLMSLSLSLFLPVFLHELRTSSRPNFQVFHNSARPPSCFLPALLANFITDPPYVAAVLDEVLRSPTDPLTSSASLRYAPICITPAARYRRPPQSLFDGARMEPLTSRPCRGLKLQKIHSFF
jgi:hypothetical protein